MSKELALWSHNSQNKTCGIQILRDVRSEKEKMSLRIRRALDNCSSSHDE
jgi:hypothetical protein